jgi:hypothetical protein
LSITITTVTSFPNNQYSKGVVNKKGLPAATDNPKRLKHFSPTQGKNNSIMANLPQIILLYKTDFHHSYSSRDLIGVFSSKRKFISAVKKIITADLKQDPQDKEGQELRDYIRWNLEFLLEKQQTQGLSNFELVTETADLNTIF